MVVVWVDREAAWGGRVLLSSPNCSGTHNVAAGDLKPEVLFLSLPLEFWDYKCALLKLIFDVQ